MTGPKDLDAAEWEDLARSEPYFAVLTHDGAGSVDANRIATDAFLETGEADISSLIPAIESMLGRALPLASALDFGCGAGRLTLPLARRAATVVACDIAPTMLEHARRNAQHAGLHNVTFIESTDLTRARDGQFDFVCSLLVFQYIPTAAGYATIRTLLRLLTPGGIAALQFALKRHGRTAKPGYAIQEYDERAVEEVIVGARAKLVGRFPIDHGDATGAVLIIEKC